MITFLSSALLAMASSSSRNGLDQPGPPSSSSSYYSSSSFPSLSSDSMYVTSLSRFAVKGLGPDHFTSVYLHTPGETFPDDRRFALLKQKETEEDNKKKKFDSQNPQWLHKENFLCAFTAPELMATLMTEYRIIKRDENDEQEDTGASFTHASCDQIMPHLTDDSDNNNDGPSMKRTIKRMLTIWKRDPKDPTKKESKEPILGPINLDIESGRFRLSQFFKELSGVNVVCVTADDDNDNNNNNDEENRRSTSTNTLSPPPSSSSSLSLRPHRHQFGNTSSGVKHQNDTRTVHIINAETVRDFSNKLGGSVPLLSPQRFRPNIIVQGLEPWKEFDLIGKTLCVFPHHGSKKNGKDGADDGNNEDDTSTTTTTRRRRNTMKLKIISKTVRCAGVSVDRLDPQAGVLDIPALLVQHFPQYGPYLGVYAVITEGGRLSVGDTMKVLIDNDVE